MRTLKKVAASEKMMDITLHVNEMMDYGAGKASVNFGKRHSVFQENETSQSTHDGKHQVAVDLRSLAGSYQEYTDSLLGTRYSGLDLGC